MIRLMVKVNHQLESQMIPLSKPPKSQRQERKRLVKQLQRLLQGLSNRELQNLVHQLWFNSQAQGFRSHQAQQRRSYNLEHPLRVNLEHPQLQRPERSHQLRQQRPLYPLKLNRPSSSDRQ